MAVSRTTRLGVYRWTSDLDPFTRQQMDDSHLALENVAAKFTQGTTLPAPAATHARSFFLQTTTNLLYYFQGVDENGQWVLVNNLGNTVQPLVFGGTGTPGTSTLTARVDHVHPVPEVDLTDFVRRSTVLQKGDLLTGTAASVVVRLPVGTNGQALRANSSTSTGLEWSAFALVGLSDVNPAGLSDGKSIKWNAAQQRWIMVDSRSDEFGDPLKMILTFAYP